jgi:hypothetical protein
MEVGSDREGDNTSGNLTGAVLSLLFPSPLFMNTRSTRGELTVGRSDEGDTGLGEFSIAAIDGSESRGLAAFFSCSSLLEVPSLSPTPLLLEAEFHAVASMYGVEYAELE